MRRRGRGCTSCAERWCAPGSLIGTDGAPTLRRLATLSYTHEYVTGYHAPDLDEVMPGVHLVASLRKRWIAGTLHHDISREQLPYYLDEYSFRFNRRNSRARDALSASCGLLPAAPASTTVTVCMSRSTSRSSRPTARAVPPSHCYSLRCWVRVLSPHERTRPRVRSLDTRSPRIPPHSVTGAAPRVRVAVLIDDAT
jgi:hypothetical protein